MAVYYKFKSAKDYDSIPIDGHFISVAYLKEKIFESKHLNKGTDMDLEVTNAQTNEEYLDDGTLIPKNTSVLIRRVAGRPRMPIVTQPDESEVDNRNECSEQAKSSFPEANSSVIKYSEDSEWDEFGNDLYSIPDVLPVHTINAIQDAPPPSKADEDSKIKALIDTPALDWQRQGCDGFGPGRGFGRGTGGRMTGGRGFGRFALERKIPPPGYVCHRCKVPGHLIQHCPTNGDPNYDIKKVKPPTGIPKSMLMATPDGSYALPSGAVAVLKPNEAAFEKEIEGLPSTRSVGDLPPELHCPFCQEVIKDAVLTSKCCFKSFCDKCIREYIISKAMCVCGATNILADDLLPNKTLRDTINRILESNNSSAENAGSTFQVQDMESARCPLPKVPSPTLSAASKGGLTLAPHNELTLNTGGIMDERKAVIPPQEILERGKTARVTDASETTLEATSMKELPSQGSAPLAEEEVQQKAYTETAKRKKKKKTRIAGNELQWRNADDLATENYMMPMGPASYNPYWNGTQFGMEGFPAPYAGAMPFMGFGPGPLDMPFGGIMPGDPFVAQGCMMPNFPPQRNLVEFGMPFNPGPPILSREEFEAKKAELRRKREFERRNESRELPKGGREIPRDMSSGGDVSSVKPKSKSSTHTSTTDIPQQHRHLPERSSPDRCSPPRAPKRKSLSADHSHRRYHEEHDDHHYRHQHHRAEASAKLSTSTESRSKLESDRKQKASVFSRISFPETEADPKKRKVPSSSEAACVPNGHAKEGSGGGKRRSISSVDYELSDDDRDRHFKRRPSRDYERERKHR